MAASGKIDDSPPGSPPSRAARLRRSAPAGSVVDLVLNPPEELRKIPQTSWYRLQRLVEPTSAACLVLTRQSMVSSAQLKIVLENSWTLETFQKADAISRLNIRVQRSHLHQFRNERAETN